jgi:hypothetical protein
MSKEKKNYINKSYGDWDSIIVQLNNGETGLANIKMMRQDLEAMAKNHSTNRGEVMEMLVQALEDEYKSKEAKDQENAIS